MAQNSNSDDWIMPASIPFSELKGKDLEECVYWLLDAMGAKDLEWRTGGAGGGAPDGGRDLEAVFYTPTVDGELEAQKWWIECKGRKRTVEPAEIQTAVNNAQAVHGLEYLVVATNTQFSNPTRDWIKTWQATHPKPKIKLWDRAQLERYLSRHPEVVLRLFSEALSIKGRLKALESRFWNKLEFVSPKNLADVWDARHDLKFEAAEMFALIANEFGAGNIAHRPWGAALDSGIIPVLSIGLFNLTYLSVRSSKAGVDQRILYRTFAYIILVALDHAPAEDVAHVMRVSLNRGEDNPLPEEFQNMLMRPILDQLLSEMQDLCGSQCDRMLLTDRRVLRDGRDECDDYWLRLEPEGMAEPNQREILRIEKLDEPCIVGFPVDADNGCPLFHTEATTSNMERLLSVVGRVTAFRKRQAAEKRQALQARERIR